MTWEEETWSARHLERGISGSINVETEGSHMTFR